MKATVLRRFTHGSRDYVPGDPFYLDDDRKMRQYHRVGFVGEPSVVIPPVGTAQDAQSAASKPNKRREAAHASN